MVDPVTFAITLAVSFAVNTALMLLFPTRVKGPKTELRAPTEARPGSTKPEGMGHVRMNAGALIWQGVYSDGKRFKYVKHESGSKGSKVTTYTTHTSFAVEICHTQDLPDRQIKGVRRIWESGKLIYDASRSWEDQFRQALRDQFDANPSLFLSPVGIIAAYNRAIKSIDLGPTEIHLGSEEQQPSSTIEGFEGAGNVSAFRGTAYMVFEDRDVTKFGAIPQYEVEFITGGVSEEGTEEWYEPQTWGPFPKPLQWEPVCHGDAYPYSDYSGWEFDSGYRYATMTEAVQHFIDLHPLDNFEFSDAGGAFPATAYTEVYRTTSRAKQQFVVLAHKRAWDILTSYPLKKGLWGGNVADADLGKCFIELKYGRLGIVWGSVPSGGDWASTIPAEYRDATYSDGGGLASSWYSSNSRWWGVTYTRLVIIGRERADLACYYENGVEPNANELDELTGHTTMPDDPRSVFHFLDGTARPLGTVASASGTFKQLQEGTAPARGSRPDLLTSGMDDNIAATYDVPLGPCLVSGSDLDDQDTWDPWAARLGVSGTYGVDYPVNVTDACLTGYLSPFVAPSNLLLKTVIEYDCSKAGIDSSYLSFDSGFDSRYATGRFNASDRSAEEKIAELSSLYGFDVAEYDGKLNFITRSVAAASPVTIDWEEFGAGTPGSAKMERIEVEAQMADELPRRLLLQYLDEDLLFEETHQVAERRTLGAKGEETMTSTVPMDADTAAALVERVHTAAWCSVYGRYKFTLRSGYSHITPATWIQTTDDNGRSYQFRVEKVTRQTNGLIECEAVADRAINYTLSGLSVFSAPTFYFADTTQGPTRLLSLHIPSFRNNETLTPGFYLLPVRYYTGWTGCVIERRLYTGDDWTQDFIGGGAAENAAYAGHLESPVFPVNNRLPDETTEITLRLFITPTLTNQSDEQWLNDNWLIAIPTYDGDLEQDTFELISWRDFTNNGDGTYTFSHLIRGVAGTKMAAASSGPAYLFQSSALRFIPASGRYSSDVEYRAASFETPTDYAPITIVAGLNSAGLGLSPQDVTANVSGGTVTVAWAPRGAGGFGLDWSEHPHITHYEIDYYNSAGTAVSSTTSTASADDTSVQFSGTTGRLVKVYAVSSQTGRGRPGSAITA